MASIKDDIANGQTSFRTELSEERSAFTQEIAKIHEAQLIALNRKDNRLATITVVFLAFMFLLPALIIYLHRQEYL